MTRPPLVLLEWEDAFNGNHSWSDMDELPKEFRPVIIETVGFEIHRNAKRTTLAMTFQSEDGERISRSLDLMTIPAGCIRKRKVLRPADKKRATP